MYSLKTKTNKQKNLASIAILQTGNRFRKVKGQQHMGTSQWHKMPLKDRIFFSIL